MALLQRYCCPVNWRWSQPTACLRRRSKDSSQFTNWLRDFAGNWRVRARRKRVNCLRASKVSNLAFVGKAGCREDGPGGQKRLVGQVLAAWLKVMLQSFSRSYLDREFPQRFQ